MWKNHNSISKRLLGRRKTDSSHANGRICASNFVYILRKAPFVKCNFPRLALVCVTRAKSGCETKYLEHHHFRAHWQLPRQLALLEQMSLHSTMK